MARKSFFQTIYDAVEEGIDDLRRGRPLTVHQVEIPDPPRPMSAREIIRLRKDKLRVSQAVFAQLVNTAPQTIHAWEQGRNRPSGIALRFLRLVERHPEMLGDLVAGKRTVRPVRRAAKVSKTRVRAKSA